jgi:signal transduction histidine kinase
LPRLLGDENKLQQIFLNLILNARDAMPSGGWLTISTSANRSYVIAEVADTGHGISKEDIKRIYDPFFTTKKTGAAGTGLGLSISYGIVQEHAGHISVDSVPGKGTRFEIRLPALDMVRGELGSGIKGRSTRARSG